MVRDPVVFDTEKDLPAVTAPYIGKSVALDL